MVSVLVEMFVAISTVALLVVAGSIIITIVIHLPRLGILVVFTIPAMLIITIIATATHTAVLLSVIAVPFLLHTANGGSSGLYILIGRVSFELRIIL